MPRAVVLAVVTLAVAPSTAAAATVARIVPGPTFSTALNVVGGAEVNNVTIAPSGPNSVVSDPGGVSSDGTCTQLSATSVSCPPRVTGSIEIGTQLQVDLGDSNDVLSVNAPDPSLRIDAGPGNDVVQVDGLSVGVSFLGREIRGGAGADLLISSEEREALNGGDGGDLLVGRGGRDTLVGGLGPDVMDGGAGGDTIDYSDRGESIFVAIDPLANDGAAGEGDFVVPEAQPNPAAAEGDEIHGGAGSDFLIGDAGGNQIYSGNGNDVVFGQGGNDWVFLALGDDYANGGAGNDALEGELGKDTLFGDAGDDTLQVNGPSEDRDGAADSVSGGAGIDTYNACDAPNVGLCPADDPTLISLDDVANDNLESDNIGSDVETLVTSRTPDILVGNDAGQAFVTADGADLLAPRGGGDLVFSQGGDDRIDLRDGVADAVDCGPGSDYVLADAGDQHQNCEHVDVAAAAQVGTAAARSQMRSRLRAGPPSSEGRR